MENFACNRKNSKKYLKSINITEKTHTRMYITNLFQEMSWFFLITFTGIFGQILFRIYYIKVGLHQWWWLFIIYFFMPIVSVIPAIALCTHAFWIDKFEYWYNDNVKDDSDYPFFFKWICKYILALGKAKYLPLDFKELPIFS